MFSYLGLVHHVRLTGPRVHRWGIGFLLGILRTTPSTTYTTQFAKLSCAHDYGASVRLLLQRQPASSSMPVSCPGGSIAQHRPRQITSSPRVPTHGQHLVALREHEHSLRSEAARPVTQHPCAAACTPSYLPPQSATEKFYCLHSGPVTVNDIQVCAQSSEGAITIDHLSESTTIRRIHSNHHSSVRW